MSFSSAVKNIPVLFDDSLSLVSHVTALCKATFYHLNDSMDRYNCVSSAGADPENSERGGRVPHTFSRMKTVFFRRYSIQHCGRIRDAIQKNGRLIPTAKIGKEIKQP